MSISAQLVDNASNHMARVSSRSTITKKNSQQKHKIEADHALRKRLQSIIKDLHQIGTLRGFKYFSLYIRGKEELIINVVNEPSSYGPSYVRDARCPSSPGIIPASPMITGSDRAPPLPQPSASFTSGDLPYDKNCLMLSQTTQMKLSGYEEEGVGLPPASPSEQELQNDPHTTLFLLACYSRYGCPYVWVRSNHERLVKLGRDRANKDKDNPLKLKSTLNWRSQDLHIWHILVEVVRLCAYPAPHNPLAVDFSYLEELPAVERLLATGSLLQLLDKVVLSTQDDKLYISHVLEDYRHLTLEHMKTLSQLISTGQISLPQSLQQTSYMTR